MSFDKSLYIITDQGAHGDSRYKNVSKQPDTLTGEVAENKQVFDDYPDLISERHNSLINNLESVVASSVTETVLKSALLDIFYPIGSYYETSKPVSEFHPETAWGGTWELESSGRVHVSAGDGYTIGATGGNKDAIIPQHNHTFSGDAVAGHKHSVSASTNSTGAHTHSFSATSGGGGAHTPSGSISGGAHIHYAENGRRFVEYDAGSTLYTYAIASDYYQANGYSGKSYAFFPNTGTLSAGSGKPVDETFQSNIATASATPSMSFSGNAVGNHTHSVSGTTGSNGGHSHTVTVSESTAGGFTPSGTISTVGTSVTNANMQPYIVVNRWHRTA